MKIKTSFPLSGFFVFLVVSSLFAGFAFVWPRALVRLLGEQSPWISYLYTYGMGLLVFSLNTVGIFSQKGAQKERRKRELKWLAVLAIGLVFMFLLHGFWILAALYFPQKALP